MKNSTKLYEAARCGNVGEVDSLLANNLFNNNEINSAFSIACINGRFDAVNFMLNHQDISKRPVLYSSDPNYLNEALHGFLKACQNDYINIVKLIVNNPDIHNRPNLMNSGILALRCAASSGSVDVIKYMLELPEIKSQISNMQEKMSLFYTALVNLQDEVLKFMIFDLSFKKTNDVSNMLSELWDQNYSSFVDAMFFTRELYGEMNDSLKEKKEYKLKTHWGNKV